MMVSLACYSQSSSRVRPASTPVGPSPRSADYPQAPACLGSARLRQAAGPRTLPATGSSGVRQCLGWAGPERAGSQPSTSDP